MYLCALSIMKYVCLLSQQGVPFYFGKHLWKSQIMEIILQVCKRFGIITFPMFSTWWTFRGGLISESFSILKKMCKIIILSIFPLIWKDAQVSDLAHFFEDGVKWNFCSEIEPLLHLHSSPIVRWWYSEILTNQFFFGFFP